MSLLSLCFMSGQTPAVRGGSSRPSFRSYHLLFHSLTAMPAFFLLFFFSCHSLVLATLLAPLGAHHRVFQRVCVKLAPALQRLDFSIHGYMMSKPIDNQCKPRVCSSFVLLTLQSGIGAREIINPFTCLSCSPAEAHPRCSLR